VARDDDDIWFPEKAARQLAVLEQPEVDVVVSGCRSMSTAVRRSLRACEVTFADLLAGRLMEADPAPRWCGGGAWIGPVP
jgi:hypothetical protein